MVFLLQILAAISRLDEGGVESSVSGMGTVTHPGTALSFLEPDIECLVFGISGLNDRLVSIQYTTGNLSFRDGFSDTVMESILFIDFHEYYVSQAGEAE